MAGRRPVLGWAVAGGFLVGGATVALGSRLMPAVMAGWCVLVVVYATLMLRHLWAAEPETMRLRAKDLAEGRWTVLTLSLGAAVIALGAVAWESAMAPKPVHWISPVLTVTTIILSWFFVHMLFSHDYAHEYWRDEGGIEFPGGDGTPEFSEFLYLGFTIGMTAQVSDVTTSSPAMRRLVLLHGLVSFAFNAVILAVSVNIAASLVG